MVQKDVMGSIRQVLAVESKCRPLGHWYKAILSTEEYYTICRIAHDTKLFWKKLNPWPWEIKDLVSETTCFQVGSVNLLNYKVGRAQKQSSISWKWYTEPKQDQRTQISYINQDNPVIYHSCRSGHNPYSCQGEDGGYMTSWRRNTYLSLDYIWFTQYLGTRWKITSDFIMANIHTSS